MIIPLFIHQIHYDMFRPVAKAIIGQHYPMMAPATARNIQWIWWTNKDTIIYSVVLIGGSVTKIYALWVTSFREINLCSTRHVFPWS